MKTEEFIVHKTYRGGTEIAIATTIYPNAVARMAASIAERISLVACVEDGEDSAGRQKLRLATEIECATRACGIAAALWSEFEQRGWLSTVPKPTYPDDEL